MAMQSLAATMTSTVSATLKLKAFKVSGTACKAANSSPKLEIKATLKANAESVSIKKSVAVAGPRRYSLQVIYLDLTHSVHTSLKPYAKSKASRTFSFSYFVC
jgi:hypothetical protein